MRLLTLVVFARKTISDTIIFNSSSMTFTRGQGQSARTKLYSLEKMVKDVDLAEFEFLKFEFPFRFLLNA